MNQKRRSFVFLAHWVENWNWLLRFIRDLHRHPENAWRWRWLFPIYWVVSLFYLFGGKAYDTVDNYVFNGKLQGETMLIRNMGWHFFLKNQRPKIKARILEAVLEAQERVDVIGLGALNKAEWLTAGGKWIVEQLDKKLKVPIVHGDTLTASVVARQIKKYIRLQKNGACVFLTGATSKIGRAVALDLIKNHITVYMFTKSRERFETIQTEAGSNREYLIQSENLCDGLNCSIWITGKAIPSGKKLLRFAPQKALLLNFSVPNPITQKLLESRTDITAIETGLIAYNPQITNLRFTMRLKPGLTYACHAGTMVHALMDWKYHEVGPVEIEQMDVAWKAAMELGFRLPRTEEVLVSAPEKAKISWLKQAGEFICSTFF